ncbi:MAG: amidohydrolase, partial [Christensenellaceae bacterium]|nr:amidohydrolase [Christensenellaceae bacterium]
DALQVLCATGVKAVFYAKDAHKTLAFRADMDALPVEEKKGAEYASLHRGCMHACGHDAHMATMLTLAHLAANARDEGSLKHNMVFLFEPAEEEDGGALPLIREGALKDPDVDEIYGLHVWPQLEQGMIGIREGTQMSCLTDFDVIIHGKSAHGAQPQEGVDALVAAASFITAAQTLISRVTDPLQMAALTFGCIEGGTSRNVICPRVSIGGTLRTFDNALTDRIMAGLRDILAGLEQANGVKTQLKTLVEYPAVVNLPPLTDKVVSAAKAAGVPVAEVAPALPSEDFSRYQQAANGVFFFLGTGSPAHHAPLHADTFDLDEGALIGGLAVLCRVAEIDG